MFSFRVGPFPVRVYAWFFLSAVVLGSAYGFGWQMLAWIFVVFVSVLCHELGHAVVGRAFGGHPEIHLQAFGGVTFPQLRKPPGPGRQFVLSFAGPLFGLLLGAVAYGLVRYFPPAPGSPVDWTMGQFMWISVVWAVFNLLPILPLDGGQMMLAVVEGVRRKPSVAAASWISVVVAVAVGALAFLVRADPMLLLFLGLFAFQNVQRARLAGRAEAAAPQGSSPDPFDATEIESASGEIRALLQSREHDAALAVAARLESRGGALATAAALRLRAGIELSRGDNEAAALYAGQSFSIWPTPDAAVVAARANLRSGQADRARNWLRRAMEAGAPPGAVQSDPELGALS